MAGLIILLIAAGCAAYQFLKGTFLRAFASFIVTICATIIAFSFFEVLAGVFISGRDSSFKFLPAPWMQTISFLLLFLFAFALLQTLAQYLTKQPVDLGLWPERIGRIGFGALSGILLASLLLTAAAMAPLPNQYPYQRFNQRSPDADRPAKAIFSSDSFAAGLFSTVSKGSFSGKRSFATIHPAFLDQLFLNRHKASDGISTITSSQPITLPNKNAAWPAPENLKDSDGNPVSPKSGHVLMFVRVGIIKSTVDEAGSFTPSQLRLICIKQTDLKDPLAGTGQNIYPTGFLTAPDQIKIKRLSEVINVTRTDFEDKAREKWIDFIFNVPADSVPILLEFKQNSIVQVPKPVSPDQAPPPAPFAPSSGIKQDTPKTENPAKPEISSRSDRPNNSTDGGGLSPITRPLVAPQLDDFK
ncbi:MAG: CvpA family protein [Planctomycetota bacterium]|jgi:hypothetical protein